MPRTKKIPLPSSGEPLMAMYAEGSEDTATTRTRRNRASTIERTDKYANIDSGGLPFRFSTGYSGNEIDARDAIILCQKAYFNVPIVRNIVELMTEFSIGDIYFQGGSKVARDFCTAWWNKVNGNGLQDRHYREYYRSGNNFIYRFDAMLKAGDIRKIIGLFNTTTKASEIDKLKSENLKLPTRYIILNPADILFSGGISFYSGAYLKRLSDFELQRLRKPQTEEDIEVFNSLPASVQNQIKQLKMGSVYLPLDINQVTAIFYKKQDYEPFAAPMVWPVLEDINAKLELKRLDMAIARTQQQVILLVTTGTEPDKGGVNNANIVALQKLFQNESIGRILVADYTTKVEFVIPQIAELLTPAKYEQLDKDINLGLNNILVGGEKFANQSTKVDVFLARLEQGRKVFLNEFLIPEIRRISKALGFKSYPIPYYDEVKLKNNDVRDRIYVRLAELGLLTPNEAFTALDTGRLPDEERGAENQQEYKKSRDAGLYQPLIGGGKQEAEGRPGGSKAPQTTKKISPIGTKASFSLTRLIENMKLAKDLGNEVASLLKLKFKQVDLNEEQRNAATEISKIVIANEEPAVWLTKAKHYIDNPIDVNKERIQKVQDLALEHQCDDYLASLLLVSQIEE